MNVLKFSIERLHACINEADTIRHAEFPYNDSREGLNQLKSIFEDQLQELKQYDDRSDEATIRQSCKLSAVTIVNYLPLIGFILRSTNIRNGFEVCRPLSRLSKNVLEKNASGPTSSHLILSSEWDFSPYVYPDIPALPGFVLIGFPASESANPLIIPLAGHEIGHSLWAISDVSKKFSKKIKDNMIEILYKYLAEFNNHLPKKISNKVDITNDLFVVEAWASANTWALKQAEESFCDFVGIGLFGTAYLYSFSYLISPSWGGTRAYRYPGQVTRIYNMLTAAKAYGVPVPTDYSDHFDELPPPRGTRTDLFMLKIADETLDTVISELISDAMSAISKSGVTLPSTNKTNEVVNRLRKVVPAEKAASLADILNAAWKAADDTSFWKGIPVIEDNSLEVLKDLVLKSIEVLDIEQTLKETR